MPGIFVEIVGNASQFKRELDGAVRSTNRANSGFQRMGRAAKVAGLALAGGLAVGLVHAAKGAMEDEVANERLAKSFENAHVPIKAFKDRIEDATNAAVKMGFQDEEAAGSLGTLVTATHDGKKAIDLLGTAMDIARFKHVDLDSASKMLTSTMAGNVRSAKALGIVLLPVTKNVDALRARYKELGQAIPPAELATAKIADKQATAAQAIGKVNEALHGQAKAFSETAEGKSAVFNAQMDQLSDNLGKTLLPAINAVLGGLNRLAAWMVDNPAIAKAAAIGIGVLSASLYALSVALAVAGGAALPFTAPLLAAIIVIGGLSFVVYKLVTDFKKNWDLLLPIVLGPIGLILLAIHRWHTQIAAAFTAVWGAVKGIVTSAIGVVKGAIGSLDGVLGALKTAFNLVRTAAEAVAGFLKGALVGALNTVKGPLGVVKGVADGLASGFWAVVHAVEALIGALGKIHVPHISLPHIPNPFHRASGGRVLSGVSYMVGERGPELFSPGASGFITPNNRLGGSGGMTVNVYVSGSVTSEQNLAETVRKQLLRTQNRTGSLGFN